MAFPAILYGQDKDVYETGGTMLYPLGTKLITPSGSVFRYAEMGATIGVANKLYQGETRSTDWVTQAATVALAAGDTTITFRPAAGTALVANDLAGGTVLVEETDDLGHIYQVKSHPAAAGAADCVLTLEDEVTVKVAVAVAASNVLTAMKNPWKDTVIAPVTTPTAMAAGIPRVIIAANEWGWMQTYGVASCLVNGTWVLEGPLTDGSTAAGGLMPAAADTDLPIAVAMIVGVAGDFGHCFLILD